MSRVPGADLECYRSVLVTLTITSGVHDPVFKKYIYTFLQLKFITKTTLQI